MPGAGRWKTKRPPKTNANGCWYLVPVLTGSFGHSATRRQDWIWLAGIILRLLFSLFPLSNYMAALLIIRDEWDISSSQAGLLNSLFADGALVLIPLADRVSPGNGLAFSGITCAIGNLLFPHPGQQRCDGRPTAGPSLRADDRGNYRIGRRRCPGRHRGGSSRRAGVDLPCVPLPWERIQPFTPPL